MIAAALGCYCLLMGFAYMGIRVDPRITVTLFLLSMLALGKAAA